VFTLFLDNFVSACLLYLKKEKKKKEHLRHLKQYWNCGDLCHKIQFV